MLRIVLIALALVAAAAPADAQRRNAQIERQSAEPVEFGRAQNDRSQDDRVRGPGGRRIELAPQDLTDDRARQAEVERTLPYLAYTLGELHYLAFACQGSEVQTWRERMVELLELEAPGDGRRRRDLIRSFNEGYGAQQRYRARCGPEADAERASLAHRGRDLAEAVRQAYFD